MDFKPHLAPKLILEFTGIAMAAGLLGADFVQAEQSCTVEEGPKKSGLKYVEIMPVLPEPQLRSAFPNAPCMEQSIPM